MRQHIRKIKKFNERARIMSLDVGRKYTGVALSDREIKTAMVTL